MAEGFIEESPADETVEVQDSADRMPGLAGHIQSKFEDAENGRRTFESRWLQAYKNFRGVYDSTTQYRDSERSKVFIKITKTKVLAAYGQIVDILFANKKFPIVVESTPVPEGIPEFAHMTTPIDEQQPESPYGYPGDGRDSEFSLSKYRDLPISPGPSKMGEPQVEPASEAARLMEKVIHDQLLDTNATNVLRNSIFESALLGTGIVKGPFNFYKNVHKWSTDESGERVYTPEEKIVPKIEHVSIWDFHPDPSATSIEDCEYVIQRHRLNRQQLRNLINLPYFDHEAIDYAIQKGPNYEDKYYEDTIREDDTEPYYQENRFEVLEYWGVLDAKFAREVGLELSYEISDLDHVQINAWVCGSNVLRCVLNPFTPARIPYSAFPYEVNPYQIWGVGVAENMEDAQLLMNGHVRMAIDNLALAGNLVFDVDEASLVPGQNFDIFPGKVFRRQSGVTGTAINGLKFPNTAPENIQMYQISRQLADEETGIPSIMHGQTGVSGTGRTSSGLSMLLNAGNMAVKTVIKNVDDYLLKPLGEAYFQWNMQYNNDSPDIVGDLEIKPRGTAAVMQKEVRSQRLTALLQTVANPMLAPFVKLPNLVRELAIAQDIDPDQLVNDVNEAQLYAEVLRGLQVAQQGTGPEGGPAGQPPAGMGQPNNVPDGPAPIDSSGVGDGTIGTGNVPVAGEDGFTGNAP
ncbi:MAG: portal protein [Acidimicrobiales bacterium]